MNRPLILVTNDDGIGSYFLRALIEAHQPYCDLCVAAPTSERSWIGRALTRLGDIRVCPDSRFGCPAWAIDGTPADCANIALAHLLPKGRRPDALISGINIGHNTAQPYILSSGTIGGALEGTFWGLPAFAYSLRLAKEAFESVRLQQGAVSGALRDSLTHAAHHAARLTLAHLHKPAGGLLVHNINFPEHTRPETPIRRTRPGHTFTGPLFQPTPEQPDTYQFHYAETRILDQGEGTDIACLHAGCISHSILDFSRLGVD